jgi:hypothetical protein
MIRECRLGGDANEDDSSRFQPAQSSTLQPPSLLAGRSVLPADRALHRRLPLARCSGPGATTRNPSVHASECDHARVGLRLRTASAFGRSRPLPSSRRRDIFLNVPRCRSRFGAASATEVQTGAEADRHGLHGGAGALEDGVGVAVRRGRHSTRSVAGGSLARAKEVCSDNPPRAV